MKTTEEAEAYQRGWNDAIKTILNRLDAEREIAEKKRRRRKPISRNEKTGSAIYRQSK